MMKVTNYNIPIMIMKSVCTSFVIIIITFALSCSSNVKLTNENKNSSKIMQEFEADPFGEMLTLEYSIDNREEINNSVSIKIYNIKGVLIRDLFNGFQINGNYNLEWDKKDNNNNLVEPGIYYCKIEINGKQLEPIKNLIAK